MQYYNNDMDELFRRAADGYPLKLPKEGWDAVSAILTASASVITVENKKNNQHKSGLLILMLLLVAISGTILLFILNHENKSTSSKIALKFKEDIGVQLDDNTSFKKRAIAITGNANDNTSIGEKTISPKVIKQVLFYTGNTKTSVTNVDLAYSNEWPGSKNDIDVKDLKPYKNEVRIQDINIENGMVQISTVNKECKIENEIEKVKYLILTKPENTAEKNKTKKEKRFYAGIFAGPQFSEVKGQGFSKLGLSGGLVAGMRITKKLAVETGLFVSQKKYFSSGQYFNMKTVAASMSAGMRVVSLTGKSTVLEIPVKIKYDFIKTNKGNAFGTTGISSYILAKEKNNYLAEVNGSQQKINSDYLNNGKYLAAALNISAGYEYKTKQTIIRVEPYIQIPLKGIGVGSMPVMSTGVHVGVLLPFH